MDNSTLSNGTMSNNTVAALLPSDISGLYQDFITLLILFSSLALLVYTTVINLDDEVDCIWSRRFSLPAFLYCLSRYSVIISQSLLVGLTLLPASASLTTCNLIANLYNAISFLPYIGVQGLLVARGYSLYPGNIWVALGLGISFFIGVFFGIYVPAAFPGCSSSLTSQVKAFNLVDIIFTVLTDTLVFLVTVYKVWGVWKLRRQLNLRDQESDIGGLLLSQGVLRYCFVLLVTLTNAILVERGPLDATSNFSYMQEALSIIILCRFSLDLRRRNKPQIDDVVLPTMSFSVQGARSMMRYVHETFLTELGEPTGDIEETDDTPEQDMEFETVELRCGNGPGSNSDSQSSPVDSSKEVV